MTQINSVLVFLLFLMSLYIIFLLKKKRKTSSECKNSGGGFYDDGKPRKFYITGDKHRNFGEVEKFCKQMNTRKKDVLIILGDSGINYYGDKQDEKLKNRLQEMNITLFCLHGNKENRASNIPTYGIKNFCGGKVYYQPQYPDILFAIDGEIYSFQGKKYLVIGGAESVDKLKCIALGKPYWDDEEPGEEIKLKVKETLAKMKNNVYGVLTHTCPYRFLPQEMFLSTRQSNEPKNKKMFKPTACRNTEKWLDEIYGKIKIKEWFCGHFHVDKEIDNITMLYRTIRPLYAKTDIK